MPPRPRPRPRPVAKAAVPSSPISHPSEVSEIPSKKRNSDDDDSFFIHNQGRSLREVEERAAKAAAKTAAASDDDESCSDEHGSEDTASEDGTPKPSRRSKKRVAGKEHDASKWIRRDTIAELLRGSSERDNVTDLSDEKYEDDSYRAGPSQSGLRRARSRSRSLTPPPELTEQERLHTRMAIRRVLDTESETAVRHKPVNVIEDEDMNPEDEADEPIDASLRHIIERVGNRNLNKPLLGSDQVSTSSVTIRVKWISPATAAIRPTSQLTWTFNIKKTDSLRQIAEKISQEVRVLPKELILLQNGKQVYTTITPQGLGIWDEFDLEACARVTYEAMDARSNPISTPPPQRNEDDDHSERAESPTSEASMDDSDEKFKITVRAPNLSIPLNVRPTTTCGKIVRAFLAIVVKQGGSALSPKKMSQVRLYVDGEKQDPDTPISDCDLEDGDIVEIIGL